MSYEARGVLKIEGQEGDPVERPAENVLRIHVAFEQEERFGPWTYWKVDREDDALGASQNDNDDDLGILLLNERQVPEQGGVKRRTWVGWVWGQTRVLQDG